MCLAKLGPDGGVVEGQVKSQGWKEYIWHGYAYFP